jgi:hypothetical protein
LDKVLNYILNKALHEEDWSRPQCPWLKVHQQINNYKVAKPVSKVSIGTTKSTVFIRWHPPKENQVRLKDKNFML